MRRTGRPIADVVTPIPYVALQSMLDGGAPPGRHYYWKSHRLPALSDQVKETILAEMPKDLTNVPMPKLAQHFEGLIAV